MKNWLYLIAVSGIIGTIAYIISSIGVFLKLQDSGMKFEAGLIAIMINLLISIIFLAMSIIVLQMVQALKYAHAEDDEVFFIATLAKIRTYFKTLGGMILVVVIFLLLPMIM